MSTTALPRPRIPRALKLRLHWTDRIAHVALLLMALVLLALLAAPLLSILVKSLQGRDDQWVGLANFIDYARTPALLDSL
ncbi:MAG: putative 2-aminoethylphosphonate ABC transporter permease subunit, partial [Rubrivivax sp.]